MKTIKHIQVRWLNIIGILLILVSCSPRQRPTYIIAETVPTDPSIEPTATPFDARPVYPPGTLVDYTAQSGDNLDLLSVRFGTSPSEIRFSNPEIPEGVTTLPPGFPMKMPIYYVPFWGPSYQIIPDAAFVYGPDLLDFDLRVFLDSTTGWFKYYGALIQEKYRNSAGVIRYYAENYSLNPKLLLALVEYQTGALSNPKRDRAKEESFLGFENYHRGVELQISYAADLLNDGFYRYFNGELTSLAHEDGTIENIDPWQNSATVALQYYFSQVYEGEAYKKAIGPDGFAKTFRDLFGDPWQRDLTVLPGSLTQPQYILPFQKGTTWSYTGGPHTGWGTRKPWAAIDFAPPLQTQGCVETEQYALAIADGVVARVDVGTVMLDLDGDGDERTGWVILYLHVAEEGRVKVGDRLKQGDRVGRPSCEGGKATGTHVHLARKYNGQWIPAAWSVLPFNLGGWVPVQGAEAYQGELVRGTQRVRASTLSDSASMITADK